MTRVSSSSSLRIPRLSIRYKLAAILMISAVLPVVLGLFSINYLGKHYYLLGEGQVFETTASYLSVSLSKSIDNEVGRLVEWTDHSQLASLLAHQRVKDPAPAPDQLTSTVENLERRWPSLKPEDPVITRILENPVVTQLKSYQKRHPRIVEILVTDEAGRLLAATNKSSDYYQADEDWWQRAMAATPGKWIIQGIDFDESAGVYSIDISISINLPDEGNPERIGVLKGVLDTTALFRNIPRVADQEGQHTVIALPEGQILVNLFETQIKPLQFRIPSETLVRFEPMHTSWLLGKTEEVDHALMGVAPLWLIDPGSQDAGGADIRPMWVVVYNDYKNVMAPFRRQIRLLLMMGGLLVVGFSALGLLIADIKIVRPLSYLRKTADRFIEACSSEKSAEKKGLTAALVPAALELDRINTGDEIEDVADDFRIMADKLSEYDMHLAEYQGHLEGLVENRTRELQSANEDLESFAFIVSHDLKAPLRAISTLATWLVSDHSENLNEEGRELVTMLHGRVDRLGDLITGILDYSRASRSEPKRDPVNLQEVVPKVVELLDIPGHIAYSCDDALPVVPGDETQLKQVFQNLLSNAFKYMDKEQGTVKLSCMRKGDFWEFRVEDNGPGIEEKYYDRIFKVFQTLHARDDVEGTGVGLSVVKKIIEKAGGNIQVESTVGSGSTFIFTWPVD